ncbi:MAG TPA: TonB-dependent receptor [Bacteroidales bacterium]|nr:TonB-dependent receptor [Bacteroidales bacterium]
MRRPLPDLSAFFLLMVKRILFPGLFILILPPLLYSQGIRVTGTVSAADTKETLPGATVVIKGTTIGSVTNIDGQYTITVKSESDTLVFAYMGYVSQSIRVGKQVVINVLLEPTKISLNEVVVVGYGTVKKSDLTGSVASVKSEELTKITAINPMDALQGKVAGVQIANVSGIPGSSPIVRIRGVGTLNNNNPIYVVDGVILDDISFLNSSDISSMEVLKDASATAMYGNRGANGVIIVTTKSGHGAEGKNMLNVSAETGIQTVAHMIPLLNGHDFAAISNAIEPGSYNNIDLVPNTNWQKEIFKTAPIYNFNISTSGAAKNIDYYISLGYFGQQGIVDKSSYNRITLQINNTYNLYPFFRLGHNLTFEYVNHENPPGVVYQAYRALPVLEPYNPDGSYTPIPGVGNPIAALEYSNSSDKIVRAVGNLFGELTFLKDFVLKSSFGVDAMYDKAVSFTPAYTVSPQQFNEYSLLVKGYSDRFGWLWENTLSYNKKIKKHSIDAVIGYTMQSTTSEQVSITGQNLIRDGSNFWYLSGINIYDASNQINNLGAFSDGVDANNFFSMISYLGRVNYVYGDRYLVTVTFRRDGSSKFSESNRWGNFPSFALGWNISEEKFLKNVKFISRLKLRGSWGQVGNDKIPYLGRYSLVNSEIGAVLGNPAALNPGASFGSPGNQDLKWEVTTQLDVGLEAGFFNDRLTGEFDYFRKVTDKILLQLSVPGYFGYGVGTQEWFNAAKVLNRGFEFTLGWRDQVGKFKYNINVNGTTLHNEVLTIGGVSGSDTVLYGGALGDGRYSTATVVGRPIGEFYGFKTDGIFQNQQELDSYPHLPDAGVGDLRYVDVNGDGKLDLRDRTFIGSPLPKFIFGLSFGMEIIGIDFSFDIQGQTGNKILNAKELVRPDKYNFESDVLNSWYGEGTSNSEPRPSFGGYNYDISDHYVQDGSFLRLRSIILGYSLPQSVSKKMKMQKFRIYLKAENVYTLTKFTGYSPEIGSADPLSAGIDYSVYPISSTYSIGLNLNF